MALQMVKCRPPWMLIMVSGADQGPLFMQARLLHRSHSSVAPRNNPISVRLLSSLVLHSFVCRYFRAQIISVKL